MRVDVKCLISVVMMTLLTVVAARDPIPYDGSNQKVYTIREMDSYKLYEGPECRVKALTMELWGEDITIKLHRWMVTNVWGWCHYVGRIVGDTTPGSKVVMKAKDCSCDKLLINITTNEYFYEVNPLSDPPTALPARPTSRPPVFNRHKRYTVTRTRRPLPEPHPLTNQPYPRQCEAKFSPGRRRGKPSMFDYKVLEKFFLQQPRLQLVRLDGTMPYPEDSTGPLREGYHFTWITVILRYNPAEFVSEDYNEPCGTFDKDPFYNYAARCRIVSKRRVSGWLIRKQVVTDEFDIEWECENTIDAEFMRRWTANYTLYPTPHLFHECPLYQVTDLSGKMALATALDRLPLGWQLWQIIRDESYYVNDFEMESLGLRGNSSDYVRREIHFYASASRRPGNTPPFMAEARFHCKFTEGCNCLIDKLHPPIRCEIRGLVNTRFPLMSIYFMRCDGIDEHFNTWEKAKVRGSVTGSEHAQAMIDEGVKQLNREGSRYYVTQTGYLGLEGQLDSFFNFSVDFAVRRNVVRNECPPLNKRQLCLVSDARECLLEGGFTKHGNANDYSLKMSCNCPKSEHDLSAVNEESLTYLETKIWKLMYAFTPRPEERSFFTRMNAEVQYEGLPVEFSQPWSALLQGRAYRRALAERARARANQSRSNQTLADQSHRSTLNSENDAPNL